MDVFSNYNSRTKLIMNKVLKNNRNDCNENIDNLTNNETKRDGDRCSSMSVTKNVNQFTKNIDEAAVFPVRNYETSLFFLSESENRKKLDDHVQRLKDHFFTSQDINEEMNGSFSPFDDSDIDKDYIPTPDSNDDSDYETDKKKKMQYYLNQNVIKSTNDNLQCQLQPEIDKKENEKQVQKEKSNSLNENVDQTNDNAEFPDQLQPEIEAGQNENEQQKSKKVRRKLTSAERIAQQKEKHPMRNKCQEKCRRNCVKLTEEVRKEIWSNYWSLDYTSRRKWMAKHTKLEPVKRKLVTAVKPRSECRKFTLPLQNCTELLVCRLTFLNTLGYTNDSVITELVAAMKLSPCGTLVKERRGRTPKPQVDREIIKEHIESYHPCVSHYRRHNAPNVRYLSRELTIKTMYQDFETRHPNICKVEIYRKVLKDLNVSLNQPKSDICELCTKVDEVANFEDLEIHRVKAQKANSEYKKDAEESATAEKDNTKRLYSMDLQKVMLLPMMPQVKTSFFTSRLVIFNETFATINKNSNKKSYCVVWHEALGGRKAEALVDSVLKVVTEERDVKIFTFWADNCTGQNKNWVLFTALIMEVNRPSGPDEIKIKYLTKGHTHMSADGIHGNIEKKLTKKQNVYDFQELVETIEVSRKNVFVLQLDEFRAWKNQKRITKKNDDPLKGFLLNPLVEVSFKKGTRLMAYKTDFDEEYKNLDFLRKRHSVSNIPEVLPVRGVKSLKKKNIKEKLVPLMPLNRRLFWENLPDSETSTDLVSSEQNCTENE